MTKATEQQFAAWNREAIEATLQLARVSTENAEKLARLQMDATRALLEDSIQNAQALSNIGDPQQLAARRAAMLEKSAARMVDYSRRVYELASATQTEFARLMEAQFASFNRDLGEFVESASRNAPAGAEPALAAIRQTLAAGNAVIETMTRTAKQFSDLADSGVNVAAGAAKSATRKR